MGVTFGPSEVDFADDDWRLRADGNTLYMENTETGEEFRFVNSPESGTDDVARMSDVNEAAGFSFAGGVGPMPMPWHTTEYADGLNNAEIGRVNLDTGHELEVWRLETRFRGGGTDPDFTVDVYDEDESAIIASTSSRQSGGDDPVGTSSEGATVLLRVTNDTASSQMASLTGILNIQEA